MSFLKKLFKNKVVLYLVSRYFTYFAQFLSSIIIAAKLGPYYFGIWGFLLLLINYFRISNFGIANATNILMVQHKNNEEQEKRIVAAAFTCLIGLSLLIGFFALYYGVIGIPFFEKYEVDNLFYVICLIAVFTHVNVFLMNVYRVKNSVFEVAFQQSAVPILLLVVSLIFVKEELLYSLLAVYVIGNIAALVLFLKNGKILWGGQIKLIDIKKIIGKGFFLFLYNICFYLIIVSIKTIVSIFYSVEEFGLFSFSYSLANAILLFLQALSFIVAPKIIDKLKSTDSQKIISFINAIRTSYVSMAYGLAFLSLIIFPFFLKIVPQYEPALLVLQLAVLTVVLYTNSFGYNTYLKAQNKEKTIAVIAAFSLSLNVILALLMVKVWGVGYQYVILATLITYMLYTYLCVHYGKKQLKTKDGILQNFVDFFQPSLLVPYVVAIIIVLIGNPFLMAIPFIIYLVLNLKSIKAIVDKIKTIINKPNVIDL